MRRLRWMPVLLVLSLAAAPAGAASVFGDLAGHLSVGYGKLILQTSQLPDNPERIPSRTESPPGSISLEAGLDLPLARAWRAGLDIGYDLFGSTSVQQGSEFATVDYSAFEAAALLHWLPDRLGPIHRISAGPALVSAHGDLSVTSGGATFSDLAVSQTGAAAVLQVTLIPAKPAPVRLGLELGGRWAFLPGPDWTSLDARLSFHY